MTAPAERVRVDWPSYFAHGRTCRVIECGVLRGRLAVLGELVVLEVPCRGGTPAQIAVRPDQVVPLIEDPET